LEKEKGKRKKKFREIRAKKVCNTMGNAEKGHNKTGCGKVVVPKRRASSACVCNVFLSIIILHCLHTPLQTCSEHIGGAATDHKGWLAEIVTYFSNKSLFLSLKTQTFCLGRSTYELAIL